MTNEKTMVNFKVISIEKAIKSGCVVATIQFNNNPKVFNYVRKAYDNTTVIDGCRVYFDNDYQVTKIEREYETKGVKKMSTAKQVGSTSTKIKDELTTKGIKIPEVKQVPPRLKRMKRFTTKGTKRLRCALRITFRFTLLVLQVQVRITL